MGWLVALSWCLIGVWASTWLAGRLLGRRNPIGRAVVAAALGLLIGLAGASLMQSSNPRRKLFDVDFVVISLLSTLVLVVLLGLVGRPESRDRAAPLGRPHPLRAIRRRWSRIRRYDQILLLGARYLLSARARRRAVRPDGAVGVTPTGGMDLADVLQMAGGMFVKFGQVLSTRPDIMPPHMLERLALLQDRVESVPADEVIALLTAELGAPPERLFSSFDRTPVAAASMAQVHRARLPSGAQVAVKVLRPGLDDLVERDRDIMLRLARILHDHSRWARRMGVRDLVQGFCDNLTQELDFRIEARNTLTIAEQLGPAPVVRIPAVYVELSTRRVIVTEFLDGTM
jgi:ubiquinone biosynthesis protein